MGKEVVHGRGMSILLSRIIGNALFLVTQQVDLWVAWAYNIIAAYVKRETSSAITENRTRWSIAIFS